MPAATTAAEILKAAVFHNSLSLKRSSSLWLILSTPFIPVCCLEPEAVTKVSSGPLSAEPAGGKRKRIDEEELTVKVAKKQRSNQSGGNASTPEPELTKRGGRVSRATRRKLEEEEEKEKAKSLVQTAPAPSHDDSVIVLDDSPVTVNAEKPGERSNLLK